jgi:hypothetical protein
VTAFAKSVTPQKAEEFIHSIRTLVFLQVELGPMAAELAVVAAKNGGKSLTVPKVGLLRCKYCDRAYVYQTICTTHEQIVHSIPCPLATCNQCAKLFLTQYDANKHKKEVCLRSNLNNELVV